jgi:type I restriction enzyme M protein
MAVVLPHGVLFRSGSEAKIRQYLIEQDLIDAIIGLPKNLFYNTSIPACVLVCRRHKADERQNKIVLINAEEKYQKGKTRNDMSPSDVDAVLHAYQHAQDPDGEGEGVQVRVVSGEEVKENGYSLNLGSYLQSTEKDQIGTQEALKAFLEQRIQLQKAEQNFLSKLQEAGYELS